MRRWRSRSTEAPHLALGRLGEKLAGRHLARNGYRILRRNVRLGKGGEIDLVCRDRSANALVFVEVKTRSNEDYGRPSRAVDARKRRRLIKGAMAWLRMLELPDLTFRFDVVEVIASSPPEIRILENAFALPQRYIY